MTRPVTWDEWSPDAFAAAEFQIAKETAQKWQSTVEKRRKIIKYGKHSIFQTRNHIQLVDTKKILTHIQNDEKQNLRYKNEQIRIHCYLYTRFR